jgi:hypothetical protein
MLIGLFHGAKGLLKPYVVRLLSVILLGWCAYIIIFLIFKFQQQTSTKTLSAEAIRQLELNEIKKSAASKIKDPSVKLMFDLIYEKSVWTDEGGGSGPGSTIEFTRNCRQILIDVILEYSIKSMLDAPCGSFLWMPLMLRNVSAKLAAEKGIRFKYHGVDVVEKVINESKARYANETRDWEFSVCDFSQQDLPNGYELIFSRDALQHLSYEKVILFKKEIILFGLISR